MKPKKINNTQKIQEQSNTMKNNLVVSLIITAIGFLGILISTTLQAYVITLTLIITGLGTLAFYQTEKRYWDTKQTILEVKNELLQQTKKTTRKRTKKKRTKTTKTNTQKTRQKRNATNHGLGRTQRTKKPRRRPTSHRRIK